ncbi:MAG: MFS transporter [Calditrichaeota bacterium]|nr:MFS transporter [Calditrichota bacterium]HQU74448.1 MFS transporter [Calditrichia bacterium]
MTRDATTLSHSGRRAVLLMFFANGALLANWLSRIPQIQARLNLSEGQLGLTLMGFALGVLTALSLAGGLIARFGSRRVTAKAGTLLCCLLPTLALLPHSVALECGLFLFGAGMSTMDVAMNAQGVEVERALGRPVMSSFHAAFSIGGFAGAGLGAMMASGQVGPALHFSIAGVGFLILILFAATRLLPFSAAPGSPAGGPVFRLPGRSLWPLGMVAFCSSVGEGAMADWSAVYLKKVVATADSTAAIGFAVFSITMTVGRLLGDHLAGRWGGPRLVQGGGVLAFLGLLLATLFPQVVPVMLGFAAVGAGLSIVVPLTFSAAGNFPDLAPGLGIAGVATIGYVGFLAGPPVIGLLAEAVTLRGSMVLVMLLVGSLVFTAPALRHR